MPSISITGAAIASGLGEVGVGAATAGTIGSIAAPIVTNAALGAGTSAIMGKNVGQGAMMGGLLGGLGELTPGAGALSNVMGMTPSATSAGAPTDAGGISAGTQIPASAAQLGTSTPGWSLAPGGALTQASSQVANGPSSTARTLANLMAIGQMLTQQQPSPKTPAGFNTPLNPTGYLNRTQNQNVTPTGGWQHWGEQPEQGFYSGNQIMGLANGGALSRMAPITTERGEHYVRGETGGQDDQRPAKLSDGEFVFDAGTVSRLGGGNSDAGARKLDQMRKAIARDAGAKKVVQGKVKPPLQYLAEARRTGKR